MRDRSSANAMYFLAGMATGVGIGLMTAPRSGAVTRQMLSARAGKAGSFVAGSGRDYYERGRELYEQGRRLAEEAAELFDEGRRLMESADAAGASS